MESCYQAMKDWHKQSEKWPDEAEEVGKKRDQFYLSKSPTMLESIEIRSCLNVYGEDEGSHLRQWLLDESKSAFQTQCFARVEIVRWLAAIGLKSVYQFDKATPQDPAKEQSGQWPWGEHHTKTLGYLEAAAKKWWVNYDPSDVTTAPTNAVVIAWLQSTFKIKTNKAESIASMLRPDSLPTGPRK